MGVDPGHDRMAQAAASLLKTSGIGIQNVAPLCYVINNKVMHGARPGATRIRKKTDARNADTAGRTLKKSWTGSDTEASTLESWLQRTPMGSEAWYDACEKLALILGSRGDGAGRNLWREKAWALRVAELNKTKSSQSARLACTAAARVPSVGNWKETHRAIIAALGESHPETVLAALELCRALADNGELDEAVDIAARIAAHRARTLGQKHPVTRSSRRFVADLVAERAAKQCDKPPASPQHSDTQTSMKESPATPTSPQTPPASQQEADHDNDDAAVELAHAALRLERRARSHRLHLDRREMSPTNQESVLPASCNRRRTHVKQPQGSVPRAPLARAEIALGHAERLLRRILDNVHPNLSHRRPRRKPRFRI